MAQQPIPSTNVNDKACDGLCCCSGNSQAPLGIMTDHIHKKGQWMLSYSFMSSNMQGNQIGNKSVSTETVQQQYMMAPVSMHMQMHMLMLMYGVSNHLTLMAMGGFTSNQMDMQMSTMMNMPGMTSGDMYMHSNSSGISDTRIWALYNLSKNINRHLIVSWGFQIPTGSFKQTGTTILGENQRLPYDMQIGSGSWTALPGFTYTEKNNKWYWGADAGAGIFLNNNSAGYRWGNNFHASGWLGYQILQVASASFRAEDIYSGQISGADPVLNIPVYTNNDPTTFTGNYGGNRFNLCLGLNFHIMKPFWEHFRIMTEYTQPVIQHLNGIQLKYNGDWQTGIQYIF